MHTTNPKRRDPAQATPDRCYGCHRALSVCGKAWTRQVRGASNTLHTVWYCQTCALANADTRTDRERTEDGGTTR